MMSLINIHSIIFMGNGSRFWKRSLHKNNLFYRFWQIKLTILWIDKSIRINLKIKITVFNFLKLVQTEILILMKPWNMQLNSYRSKIIVICLSYKRKISRKSSLKIKEEAFKEEAIILREMNHIEFIFWALSFLWFCFLLYINFYDKIYTYKYNTLD